LSKHCNWSKPFQKYSKIAGSSSKIENLLEYTFGMKTFDIGNTRLYIQSTSYPDFLCKTWIRVSATVSGKIFIFYLILFTQQNKTLSVKRAYVFRLISITKTMERLLKSDINRLDISTMIFLTSITPHQMQKFYKKHIGIFLNVYIYRLN